MKNIIHTPAYIPQEKIQEIKHYYDEVVNDSFSNGPKSNPKLKKQMQGCWDRPLRLENRDNPVHQLLEKLRNDFGNFEIHCSSIRYQAYPFGPHSDIRDSQWLKDYRYKFNRGYTFLIPLWWQKNYTAGTGFFSCPPADDEPLYEDCYDLLPQHAESERKMIEKNFSVKKIVKWQQPGDLIAWMNFQWHCSLGPDDVTYSDKKWVKEFISIETAYPKK